jgi:hypothetical protein
MEIENTMVIISGNRTDVYPSPMPTAWKGTLVIQTVGLENGNAIWGIVANGSPITSRFRSTNRDDVTSVAIDRIGAWRVETGNLA